MSMFGFNVNKFMSEIESRAWHIHIVMKYYLDRPERECSCLIVEPVKN